jgi:hypothetical protein
MKERLLESFAILLAGLFSAERPRPWRSPPEGGSWRTRDAAPQNDALGEEAAPPSAKRAEN